MWPHFYNYKNLFHAFKVDHLATFFESNYKSHLNNPAIGIQITDLLTIIAC